ncbi:hypothetical protein [Salinispora arenicola]|uniref:hypothetical protein n=1 Tax=Salinispora arenicola TaxID=168697 RepID=UPI0027DD2672|nr:hypothetical protein [Salinispora arenicola]
MAVPDGAPPIGEVTVRGGWHSSTWAAKKAGIAGRARWFGYAVRQPPGIDTRQALRRDTPGVEVPGQCHLSAGADGEVVGLRSVGDKGSSAP